MTQLLNYVNKELIFVLFTMRMYYGKKKEKKQKKKRLARKAKEEGKGQVKQG